VRHSNGAMIGAVDPNWSGNRWLHASPLFTFAGIALVYTPMKMGLQVIYQPRFDADRWLRVVQEERPIFIFLVPAMAHLLIDNPRFDAADLSSVQMCSVGSAPLAPYVVERLQEKMPDALVSNNYGMTEAGSAYCIMPQGEAIKRPGSVGQIAPPAIVQIVDEHDQPLPPDVVGEVRLQIPGRQREYYKDPEATADTWKDGWLITGDLGKLDADNYLYIVGRSKDVIIRGGNNVHATDVEHVLVQHDSVKEVAVVGAPHPVLGEDVVAFVVLHPDTKADADELRAFGLEHLADYKVPRQFIFVDALPRNPTGKVVKPELKARLAGESSSA
jgi:acyl-CoA synthetase (AMP-forming)/AMP-acid ligase II